MPPGSSQFDQMRLQHLTKNISDAQELLAQYESGKPLINDPGEKERYRRRILELKEMVALYQEEYEALEAKGALKQSQESAGVGNRLQRLEVKIDTLLGEQQVLIEHVDNLQEAILAGLDATERSIIAAVLTRLDQKQLELTQAILNGWKASQISQQDLQETLRTLQQALNEVQQQGNTLAHLSKEDTERLTKLIEEPTLDMSHKLAVTIPIIPFLLSYESELSLGSGLNLKAAWQRLVNKVRAKP